ncbi:thiol reductant ABC exporter subunit CydD [Paenochrobactrum glaciei]|uniref:Thiol reductant ABC exporter subunit CydD n=1 Tax=Paenochrobactrum glaciei TaxID=486407 RepID=A0ABN1FT13_9HYPH
MSRKDTDNKLELVADETQNAAKKTRKARRPRRAQPPLLKRGGWLQVLAALIWIPQAAMLAYAVGLIANAQFDSRIYGLAGGILLLGVLRSLLDAAGGRMAYRAARQALTQMRAKALQALSSRSPLDISRPSSGETASILAEQAEMMVPYLSRFVPIRQKVMTVPFVILAFVLWYSWTSALILLIAAPLIPLFMALIGMRAQKASEEQLVEMGSMNGFLLDRLRGLATIRSFGAVDQTALRLRENAETLRKKTMVVLRIAFLSSAVLELFSALGVAMVAVYIGFHLLGPLNFGAWGDKLVLSEALFVLLLAPAFFEPLRELSNAWHDRASGEAAIDALENLHIHQAPIVGAGLKADLQFKPQSQSQSITLNAIDYSYQAERKVLQDFHLAVQQGEKVAILAPSGMGKSTILALIAGLIKPQSGTVEIGGQVLTDENAGQLRGKMVWVGQKPHIFAGSVRSNISLQREHVDQSHMDAALQVMALSDVSNVMDNHMLGEGGIGLSGGEAVRLALARAAVDPDATIILADEPTAHLDRETADQITKSLLALAKGKTMLVATHDETLARHMDYVIRLDSERQNYADVRGAAE